MLKSQEADRTSIVSCIAPILVFTELYAECCTTVLQRMWSHEDAKYQVENFGTSNLERGTQYELRYTYVRLCRRHKRPWS